MPDSIETPSRPHRGAAPSTSAQESNVTADTASRNGQTSQATFLRRKIRRWSASRPNSWHGGVEDLIFRQHKTSPPKNLGSNPAAQSWLGPLSKEPGESVQQEQSAEETSVSDDNEAVRISEELRRTPEGFVWETIPGVDCSVDERSARTDRDGRRQVADSDEYSDSHYANHRRTATASPSSVTTDSASIVDSLVATDCVSPLSLPSPTGRLRRVAMSTSTCDSNVIRNSRPFFDDEDPGQITESDIYDSDGLETERHRSGTDQATVVDSSSSEDFDSASTTEEWGGVSSVGHNTRLYAAVARVVQQQQHRQAYAMSGVSTTSFASRMSLESVESVRELLLADRRDRSRFFGPRQPVPPPAFETADSDAGSLCEEQLRRPRYRIEPSRRSSTIEGFFDDEVPRGHSRQRSVPYPRDSSASDNSSDHNWDAKTSSSGSSTSTEGASRIGPRMYGVSFRQQGRQPISNLEAQLQHQQDPRLCHMHSALTQLSRDEQRAQRRMTPSEESYFSDDASPERGDQGSASSTAASQTSKPSVLGTLFRTRKHKEKSTSSPADTEGAHSQPNSVHKRFIDPTFGLSRGADSASVHNRQDVSTLTTDTSTSSRSSGDSKRVKKKTVPQHPSSSKTESFNKGSSLMVPIMTVLEHSPEADARKRIEEAKRSIAETSGKKAPKAGSPATVAADHLETNSVFDERYSVSPTSSLGAASSSSSGKTRASTAARSHVEGEKLDDRRHARVFETSGQSASLGSTPRQSPQMAATEDKKSKTKEKSKTGKAMTPAPAAGLARIIWFPEDVAPTPKTKQTKEPSKPLIAPAVETQNAPLSSKKVVRKSLSMTRIASRRVIKPSLRVDTVHKEEVGDHEDDDNGRATPTPSSWSPSRKKISPQSSKLFPFSSANTASTAATNTAATTATSHLLSNDTPEGVARQRHFRPPTASISPALSGPVNKASLPPPHPPPIECLPPLPDMTNLVSQDTGASRMGMRGSDGTRSCLPYLSSSSHSTPTPPGTRPSTVLSIPETFVSATPSIELERALYMDLGVDGTLTPLAQTGRPSMHSPEGFRGESAMAMRHRDEMAKVWES